MNEKNNLTFTHLFDRIADILDQAKNQIVRTVNSEIVVAYRHNPTIGLVLCSEKNEAIARYSVLNESKQLFAAKYLTSLPSEEELQKELQRERKLLEEKL